MLKLLTAIVGLIGLIPLSNAQNSDAVYWTVKQVSDVENKQTVVATTQYELYELDLPTVKAALKQCVKRESLRSKADYVEMKLPLYDQGLQRFAMFETSIMESELQAKYPNIRTYTGQGIDDPRQTIKVDVGPRGFHAMVYSTYGTYIIDPAFQDDVSQYMTFRKQDALESKREFICHVSDEIISSRDEDEHETFFANPTGEQLRTYRLALATTAEYSAYHGGTKELVLAAMVTAMNRVNGIYEKDLTITTVLVNNTDTLIFFDAATDPYTNNSGSTMLGENNATCNELIGSDNYDIGHVFSTGGGGIANLGSVCTGNKASGVTGSSDPVGDAFTVDYVAHEIGHQFDGNHTFNSCGGQGPRPFEPGSGVTIMGYASLCGTFDLSDHSIDIFHVANYDEIIAFSQLGDGNTCATITETGNTAPVVDVGDGGFYIPKQTPFELTGSAVDAEGDSLTYGWEQYDLGPATHPDDALSSAPLFRSWVPETDGTRVFPRIGDLVGNSHTIGELLPQFAREMNFRLTVRDNVAGGGGVDYEQLTFQVADDAGPFALDVPNGSPSRWNVGHLEPVTWDVANTDVAPVNCASVDIYLSDDGGFTYPYTLASNVPNTGYAIVKVPDAVGIKTRVKIKAADNVFFDVSNRNFFLAPSRDPDFVFASTTASQTICGEEMVEYEILIDTIVGFNLPVNFSVLDNPIGTTVTFDINDIVPPATVIVTVATTADAIPDDYQLTLLITGDTVTKELPLSLKIRAGAPEATELLTPVNGSRAIDESVSFSWDTIPQSDSYTIEISTTADFSSIVYTNSGLSEPSVDESFGLNNNSIYFWRVRGNVARCGAGDWSSIYSFQTTLSACSTFSPEDVPADIPSPGALISEINVTEDFVISDVNVTELIGDHRRVGQLVFTLINPAGDRVTLVDGICNNDNDFDLGLDDEGFVGPIPCPPVNGQSYQPVDSLALFNGSFSAGLWQLEIQDSIQQTSGGLASWALELCGPEPFGGDPIFVLEGGNVVIGDTLNIDSDNIFGHCDNFISVLQYILTGLPMHGELYINGNLAVIGTVFTQADIDNENLTYINDGVDLSPDQFEFILTCTDGPYVGGLIFDVTVDLVSSTSNINSLDFNIYPNPATEFVTIQLGESNGMTYEVNVVDLLGNIQLSKRLFSSSTTIQTSKLSSGIYFCQITVDGMVVGEQKLMVIR